MNAELIKLLKIYFAISSSCDLVCGHSKDGDRVYYLQLDEQSEIPLIEGEELNYISRIKLECKLLNDLVESNLDCTSRRNFAGGYTVKLKTIEKLTFNESEEPYIDIAVQGSSVLEALLKATITVVTKPILY